MKVALLLAVSAAGLWYNWKSTRAWWAHQKTVLPQPKDLFGWVSVGFSGLWYAFIFVFFVGLTVNNTLFR